MHVRVRFFGHPETVVVVESKLTKIEQFRRVIREKFNVEPKLQQLIYGGKLLEDGYTFHDYNIKLNDVIQLIKRVQPVDNDSNTETKNPSPEQTEKKNVEYKDTTSTLYKVGDFVDAKHNEGGNWMEGTISRIVIDPETHSDDKSSEKDKPNENILVKVKLEHETDSEEILCKLSDIRPRARCVIAPEDIQKGQIVMLNYDIDEPGEIGYWYDFKVDEVKMRRKNYELTGTLYLGLESIPQDNTNIVVKDKIYKIEDPVALSDRSEEYNKIVAEEPPKRTQPIHCKKCQDDKLKPCKQCGCFLCASKESPDEIILCDECDNGFHLKCLDPPLTAIPDDDWYCQSCRRDPNDVVAPGAAKQTKKTKVSETTRDWGRGMACVGKTKDSDMPLNHFGPIPGVEVGMIWRYRMQLSENGLHRPSVSGIHGRDAIGAFSIVLSGGYEDDVDNGNEFTYTGSGGRDLSGNKRTAEQSCDQKFTRENRALARNCAAQPVSPEGGDAGDNWRQGKPVRVMRSYKMAKAFPKYAPREGIRYDGIYKVVKYYPETGLSGFVVYKYLLRRDDPSPAPWEPEAKQYSIVYPDGYLEAEAQKKLLKQKKNGTQETQVLSENKPLRKSTSASAAGDKETSATTSRAASKQTNGARKPAAKRRRVSSSEESSQSESESSDNAEETPKNNTPSQNPAKSVPKKAKIDETQAKSQTTVKLGSAKSDTPKSKSENKSSKGRKSSSGDNKTQSKLTFTPVAKKMKKTDSQAPCTEDSENITPESSNANKSSKRHKSSSGDNKTQSKLTFTPVAKKVNQNTVAQASCKDSENITPESSNANKSSKRHKNSSGDNKTQSKLTFTEVAKKVNQNTVARASCKDSENITPESSNANKSSKRHKNSSGDNKTQSKLTFTEVAKKVNQNTVARASCKDSENITPESSNANKSSKRHKSSSGDNKTQSKLLTFTPVAKKVNQNTVAQASCKDSENITPESSNANKSSKRHKSSSGDNKTQSKLTFTPVAKKVNQNTVAQASCKDSENITPESSNANKSSKRHKNSSGDNKTQSKLTFTPVAKKVNQNTVARASCKDSENITPESSNANKSSKRHKSSSGDSGDNKTQSKLTFTPVAKKVNQNTVAQASCKDSENITPESSNANKSSKRHKSSSGDNKTQSKLTFTPVAKKVNQNTVAQASCKDSENITPESSNANKSSKRHKNSSGDNKTQSKLTFTEVAKKVNQNTVAQASCSKVSKFSSEEEHNKENVKLSASEREAIQSDRLNAKLWDECLEICRRESKTQFIEHVMEVFRCIICQGPAVCPVTTPCLHNFCLSCMKRAFKATGSKCCPYCRQTLADFELSTNEHLTTALRTLLPGYDAGHK